MLVQSTSRTISLSRPRTSVRNLVKNFLEMDRRYRMRVQLLELDERLLRDMGLNRADVMAEVRRPLL